MNMAVIKTETAKRNYRTMDKKYADSMLLSWRFKAEKYEMILWFLIHRGYCSYQLLRNGHPDWFDWKRWHGRGYKIKKSGIKAVQFWC